MNTDKKSFARVLGLALVAVFLAAPSGAQEIAAKGRAIFNQHSHAVTLVQFVLKTIVTAPTSTGGTNEMRQTARTNETRHTITGTVVAPTGLVAVSLSAVDPGQNLKNMIAAQNPQLKVDVSQPEMEILLDDGTPALAEVAYRDKELDLALVRAKGKLPAPMAAVDLSQGGKADVLDELIALNRLGRAGGWARSASLERVSAVLQQPRLLYVPEANMTTSTLGAPAFTLDGKFLGIFVIRTANSRNATGALDAPAEGMTVVVLPADELAKAVATIPPPAGAK